MLSKRKNFFQNKYLVYKNFDSLKDFVSSQVIHLIWAQNYLQRKKMKYKLNNK
jgi:hypothetical protein